MNIRLAVALIFAGFISSVVSAQDEITVAEEVLRYFPAGTYTYIYHQDDAMFDTMVYEQHSEYVEKHFPGKSEFSTVLPHHLVSKDLSETQAVLSTLHIVKDYIHVGDDPGAYNDAHGKWRKRKEKEGFGFLTSGVDTEAPKKEGKEAIIAVLYEAHPLYVYQFKDVEELLNKYISVGEFKKSRFTINEKPVWTNKLSRFGRPEESSNFYYYATEHKELLVAESIEFLEMMLAAAGGEIPTLVNDERYPDLVRTIKTLPNHNWYISLKMVEFGQHPDYEIRLAETNPISWLKYYYFGETIKEWEVYVYDTERTAKRRLENNSYTYTIEQLKKENNQSRIKWHEMLEEATERKQEGTRVISVRTYDKYLIHRVMNWERDQELKHRMEWIKKKREEALKQ